MIYLLESLFNYSKQGNFTMNQETLIGTLKEYYPRDIRKQLVKTILSNEKNTKPSADQYALINQIFSYVLKEYNWNMPTNSTQWDIEPLKIMASVFPRLDSTKWYTDQLLLAKQDINVVLNK